MSLFERRRRSPLQAEAVTPGRRGLLSLGCACCLSAALPISRAAAQSPAVQRHLEAARQAAGDDLRHLLRLGLAASPSSVAAQPSLEQLIAQPAPPPAKAFDKLYFVGGKWVSAWAIPTSDGIILIDALNNDEEAERLVDRGLRQLGLDPAQIRLVVVTHGHGDHYGGAGHFVRRYNSRVVMSGADWTMTETALEFDSPVWGRPPRRDVVVEDGGTVRLGDTNIEVLLTPGHTRGTISLIFDVQHDGRPHRALLWGGTAFNFGRQPDRMQRIQAYIDGAARAHEIAGRRNIDVFLSNHPGWDEADAKLARMRPRGDNPFASGVATTQRALTVMRECALATQAAWSA